MGLIGEVTPEVRLLRSLGSAALQILPRRALQEALGLSDDEHFRKTFLLPALAGGLIEMTLPDKPTSRMQQYRLTAAGRTRLHALTTRGKPP
jgi:ATP-dependent DNA helicase RecG